jgi:hypothetical protein
MYGFRWLSSEGIRLIEILADWSNQVKRLCQSHGANLSTLAFICEIGLFQDEFDGSSVAVPEAANDTILTIAILVWLKLRNKWLASHGNGMEVSWHSSCLPHRHELCLRKC